MDNIFFAHPENINGNQLELVDQEAVHASKVLRFERGDELFAADGQGNIYQTSVVSASKKSVIAEIQKTDFETEPEIKKVLAFGAIKKRDRLEFTIEKAVELGAWEICVFNADHSERSKINEDRLQSIVMSAFKQCKRTWLPKVLYLDSMEEVLKHYTSYASLMAHVDSKVNKPSKLTKPDNLLLVGPEGGFSDREVELAKESEVEFISLGKNRLRAETASIAFLSQYLFSE